jgi:hypothetical protein
MMKNIFVIGLLAILSVPLMAQKVAKLNVKKLRVALQTSDSDIGPIFLKSGLKATQTKDDDCKPPPCFGIIDPWTCECYPEIKDPWEEDKIASKMKAALEFETAIQKGQLKELFPPSIVDQARKIFPSRSLKAIVGRMNYYSNSLK